MVNMGNRVMSDIVVIIIVVDNIVVVTVVVVVVRLKHCRGRRPHSNIAGRELV